MHIDSIKAFASGCGVRHETLLTAGDGKSALVSVRSDTRVATLIVQDKLNQIENVVNDIKNASFRTANLSRHIEKLAGLLRSQELEDVNQELTRDIDLEPWFEHEGGYTPWPTDTKGDLGLIVLLVDRFSENLNYFSSFSRKYFYTGENWFEEGVRHIADQLFVPFARDYTNYVRQAKRIT